MQVENYNELERQIRKTRCPACGYGPLDFRLRCDVGSGRYLRFVSCERCSALFQVSMAAERLATDSAHVQDLLQAFRCAHCGGAALELEFRCSLETGTSSFSISCRACKRPAPGLAPQN